MSLRAVLSLVLVASVSSATGCLAGSIRVVRVGQTEGELALTGNMPSEAWQKAYAYMEGQCGVPGYEIVEQGEQVVGQTTNESSYTSTSKNGKRAQTSTYATTSDVKEWRVHYRCKSPAGQEGSAVGELRSVLITL